MFRQIILTTLLLGLILHCGSASAQKDSHKSYLEDIFIWKMSDELKLSIAEEKKFSEIQKDLNKRKLNLNKAVQVSIEKMPDLKEKSEIEINNKLDQHAKLLRKYNHLGVEEFEAMRKLLGARKLLEYIRVRNDLTNKVKSMLAGDSDKKELKETKEDNASVVLPPPKIILED